MIWDQLRSGRGGVCDERGVVHRVCGAAAQSLSGAAAGNMNAPQAMTMRGVLIHAFLLDRSFGRANPIRYLLCRIHDSQRTCGAPLTLAASGITGTIKTGPGVPSWTTKAWPTGLSSVPRSAFVTYGT